MNGFHRNFTVTTSGLVHAVVPELSEQKQCPAVRTLFLAISVPEQPLSPTDRSTTESRSVTGTGTPLWTSEMTDAAGSSSVTHAASGNSRIDGIEKRIISNLLGGPPQAACRRKLARRRALPRLSGRTDRSSR